MAENGQPHLRRWMKENQVAIEAGIKTDVTESFMVLKELFETHYVTMQRIV